MSEEPELNGLGLEDVEEPGGEGAHGVALCGDRTVALSGELVECREPLGHRGHHSQGFHGGWVWANPGEPALDLGTTKAGTIVETVNEAGEKGFGRLSADVGVYIVPRVKDEPDVSASSGVPKAWQGSHPPPDPGPEVCGCDESKRLAETIVDLDRSLKAERASGAAVVQELLLAKRREAHAIKCAERWREQYLLLADFGVAAPKGASPAPPPRSVLARAFLTARLAELAGVALAGVVAVAIRVEGALSRAVGD